MIENINEIKKQYPFLQKWSDTHAWGLYKKIQERQVIINKIKIMFTNYNEYKQYVNEEWKQGGINELYEDGLIVEIEESYDYECESKQVNYRKLTEDEFNIRFKQLTL